MKKTLSKTEIEALNAKLNLAYGVSLLNKKDFVQNTDDKFISVNGEIEFFFNEGQWIPSLKSIAKNNFLKIVTVDMGAIKFIISGADIMKPGIVDTDPSIKAGEYVVVVDVTNKKPICIGKALFSAKEINDFLQGRVVKNLHWVGDEIWKTV